MNRWVFAICIAALAAGCSTYSNEFVDADGTRYKSNLMVAPFSKLEGGDASMGYKWNAEEGSIAVGARVQSLDNTPQTEALRVAIDAAVKAAIAGAVRSAVPLPLPAH